MSLWVEVRNLCAMKDRRRGTRRADVHSFTLQIHALLIGSSCLVVCSCFPFSAHAEMTMAASASTDAESASTSQAEPLKRPVTVADVIQMTRFGDTSYTAGLSSKGIVGRFSPDGKRFV